MGLDPPGPAKFGVGIFGPYVADPPPSKSAPPVLIYKSSMKHIRLYEDEDLLKDLSNIGFDPSIGFMFLGITSRRRDDRPLGFLVKAKDEKTCVKMLIESMKMDNPFITSGYDSVPKNSTLSFDSMTDLMVYLFEQGYVIDSGYYGPFKAKDSSQELILMVDEYMINAKDFVDLAYKHFTNVDETFREAGHPQEFKYTPKDLGL